MVNKARDTAEVRERLASSALHEGVDYRQLHEIERWEWVLWYWTNVSTGEERELGESGSKWMKKGGLREIIGAKASDEDWKAWHWAWEKRK